MTEVKGPDYLIIGMEKSGTTWCSTILNGHPNILSVSIRVDWKGQGKQIRNDWDKELMDVMDFSMVVICSCNCLNRNSSS